VDERVMIHPAHIAESLRLATHMVDGFATACFLVGDNEEWDIPTPFQRRIQEIAKQPDGAKVLDRYRHARRELGVSWRDA
jgi:hypothetical protein